MGQITELLGDEPAAAGGGGGGSAEGCGGSARSSAEGRGGTRAPRRSPRFTTPAPAPAPTPAPAPASPPRTAAMSSRTAAPPHARPAPEQPPKVPAAAQRDLPDDDDDNYTAGSDPFVAFVVVSLVALQLALQTDALSPLFNSLPLTRWSRWLGVLAAVAVGALLPGPGPHAMGALLALAALSCDASVALGRRAGSMLGLALGPEWGPAAASALLASGSLVAAARLAVNTRRGLGRAALHAVAVAGTLWSGEKLVRKLLQLTICVPCRRVTADAETLTLVLAYLFTALAFVSYVPPRAAGDTRRQWHVSRKLLALLTLPPLAYATAHLIQRPTPPFALPDAQYQVLFSQKSNSGRIVVGQTETGPNTFRFLRADHSILGGQWMRKVPDARGGSKLEFGDSIFAAFPLQEILLLAERGNLTAAPRPSPDESALIIGLGVGIAATQFIRRGLMVDVVEYDQVVYDAAAQFFSYGTRRPRSASITDGVQYVADAAAAKRGRPDAPRWNYVVQDCFSAGSLPVELFTREFWANVQDIITDDGLVIMNFAGVADSLASRKVIRTLLDVFPQCRAFSDAELRKDVPGNMVFVCTRTYDPLLTFREPTPADIDQSGLRHMVYSGFLAREVPLDSLLKPGDWADRRMVLRSGDRLGYWADAVQTWWLIERLMSPATWMAY